MIGNPSNIEDEASLELELWRAVGASEDLSDWLRALSLSLARRLQIAPRFVAQSSLEGKLLGSLDEKQICGIFSSQAGACLALILQGGHREAFWEEILAPELLPLVGPRAMIVMGPSGLDALVVGCDESLSFEVSEALLRAVHAPWRVVSARALLQRTLDDYESQLAGGGSVRARKVLSDNVVVGAHRGLALVMNRVRLVASSDATVLLLGETGSGKEVVARVIHASSRRYEGPFVRVNCGAIPPELIDSQLFGHERGAFTGATHQHIGWFERADHGTLLLDEVAELPLAAQVRLLRVLQDGELERVGGVQPIHVDCRIIAATHRDLPSMVAQGTFREDLWYRLTTFPIMIPPLRERLGDIPELAVHFARRAALQYGVRCVYPDEADTRLLQSYSWPGNIRELASVINRAVLLGAGQGPRVAEALGISLANGQAPLPVFSGRPEEEPVMALDDMLRRYLEKVLRQVDGRVEGRGGAAELLGLHPSTLRSKLRVLGIPVAQFRS